jgi:hypothetical protein
MFGCFALVLVYLIVGINGLPAVLLKKVYRLVAMGTACALNGSKAQAGAFIRGSAAGSTKG